MALSTDSQEISQSALAPTSLRLLSSIRVLVVEDDYYLAMEAKAMLEEAGADVIGPFSSLEQFERALATESADCAVVDINLGDGPSFGAARLLQAEGVPFMFMTGYSPTVIPDDLQHIVQTRKPAKAEVFVEVVRELCGPGASPPINFSSPNPE